MIRPTILITLSFLIVSCATFAPKERTELNANVPQQFSLYSETKPEAGRWWESFGSAELNALIDEALTNSPTIQQSWARLIQAQAVAAKSGAAQLPTLDYNASAAAFTKETTKLPNPGRDSFNDFKLGLAASYELDLWGRVRSQTKTSRFSNEASSEDLKASAITLASQVATRWTGIIAQRRQTEIIRQQLEANRTSQELIELRFRKSLSSALDVYQQRQTVAGTESTIPKAELAEELQMNELAVLLGRSDFDSLEIKEIQLPKVGDLPPIGIPADVLANRPDVRSAGLRLQSADWQVSAARADRLPALRLTASASYGETDIDVSDLFDNWIANLAASVTGPIFDGGRRKAEVIRTRAVVDERLADYRKVVLNAIKEVEDALVQEQKQHEFIASQKRQLEAARTSYEESINRYRNGIIEYTTVLIQLRALQNLEREVVASHLDLLTYRINLYRALGGTWPNELTISKPEEI